MDDGNKESIKELLSTFRTLFAINVSGIILLANLNERNELSYHSVKWFWAGMILAAISLSTMIYLFFLSIPKILQQEDRIIYQPDIMVVSLVSFWSFLSGYIIIVADVLSTRALG